MNSPSTGTLMFLQSVLASAQVINAGLAAFAHTNPYVVLIAAAVAAGPQNYVQHAGNQTVPPPPVKKD